MVHNVVWYDTVNNVIQQLSTADIDGLAERVLRVMAAGTYTGTITVGTTNSIGTFADTYYNQAAGTNLDSPVSTGSTIYTLSQVQTATLTASADPPMYVGLDTTSVANTTILQENATTLSNLADEILSRMVASTGGTNAYYLGTSAPADGATWVSRGTLLDTRTAGTITITDYKLWQRTTSGATITSKNPVKITSDPLQVFSDTELNALIKIIEQRIVSTGVGLYAFQASTPTPGTWTNVGTVTDTFEDVTTNTYFGTVNFNVSYTFSYLGPTDFFAWGTYPYDAGTFQGTTGFDAASPFLGPTYGTTYQHGYSKPSLVSYFGGPANAIDYQAATFGTYIRSYLGPTEYVGNYTKFYAGDYQGAPGFSSQYSRTYFPDYIRTLIGFFNYYIGGPTDATSYDVGLFSATYTNENAATYTLQTIASTTSPVTTRTLWRRIA